MIHKLVIKLLNSYINLVIKYKNLIMKTYKKSFQEITIIIIPYDYYANFRILPHNVCGLKRNRLLWGASFCETAFIIS